MLTLKFKMVFFNSARVIRAMDAATRRALTKVGAFIRTRAKTSIRKRKGVSRPGQPPHSHVGTLRRLLFFALGPDRKSVVVGPARFGAGKAPSRLEFGGKAIRISKHQSGKRGRRRIVRYRKRPFMGPALEAELPAIPSRWRNSLRGN